MTYKPGLLLSRKQDAQMRQVIHTLYYIPVFPSASGLSRGYSGMHSKKRSKMAAAFSLPYCPKICSGDWPLIKQVGKVRCICCGHDTTKDKKFPELFGAR